MTARVAPLGYAVAGVEGVAAAVATWWRRGRRLVLAGPPDAGKATLAAALAGTDGSDLLKTVRREPSLRKSGWVVVGKRATVVSVDLPGPDALRTLKEMIEDRKPHLTVLVVDYEKLSTDAEETDRVERMAEHLRSMGSRRRALVLTHTDLDDHTRSDPDAAGENPRAVLIAKKLGTNRVAGANLRALHELEELRTRLEKWS